MRKHFEELMLYLNVKEEMIKKGLYKESNKKWIDKSIIEAKRKCREALKARDKAQYLYHGIDGEGYGKIVNSGGDWDYFWRKVFFPGEHWSKEDIEEFREENWKHTRYSAYDCTGDVFTRFIDVFNTPSGVVAYIREAIDC